MTQAQATLPFCRQDILNRQQRVFLRRKVIIPSLSDAAPSSHPSAGPALTCGARAPVSRSLWPISAPSRPIGGASSAAPIITMANTPELRRPLPDMAKCGTFRVARPIARLPIRFSMPLPGWAEITGPVSRPILQWTIASCQSLARCPLILLTSLTPGCFFLLPWPAEHSPSTHQDPPDLRKLLHLETDRTHAASKKASRRPGRTSEYGVASRTLMFFPCPSRERLTDQPRRQRSATLQKKVRLLASSRRPAGAA